MPADSSAFVSWASGCTVFRGPQDISNPSAGLASAGDPSLAAGPALSSPAVSLGDGGTATCTFPEAIVDGPGFDFAVFENGFDDSFLEMAFVEVSSDGVNFVRFPSRSLTDTVSQTGSFGSTDPTKINNLAGKYRGGYGTPFDLAELAGKPGLDINNVTHVRMVDVVGSLDNAYATRDATGAKVNDPWPTPFPSSGFDLDAVGVIHNRTITGLTELPASLWAIFPQPCRSGERLFVTAPGAFIRLRTISGQLLKEGPSGLVLDLNPGLYAAEIVTGTCTRHQKIIID